MKWLFQSKIHHKRFLPKVNAFTYSGYYIKVDISKLEEIESKLFKINQFGLFSFYNKDHADRDGGDLRVWANKQLSYIGCEDVDKIVLQTFPRVLGYVFNPVSFWFCYKDEELVAVINEVNNTFGQTHIYVLDQTKHQTKLSLAKEFHVSPFFDVEGYYQFDFTRENTAIINYYVDDELKLVTSITGREINWSDRKLLSLFIRFPLYTLMSVALIHYQALKLYFKKAKFYTLPKKLQRGTTYEHSD